MRESQGGRAPSGFGTHNQAGIHPGSSQRGFVRKTRAALSFWSLEASFGQRGKWV